MKTYKIVKEFFVDAEDMCKAEDAASWIGSAALTDPKCSCYLSETTKIEELNE